MLEALEKFEINLLFAIYFNAKLFPSWVKVLFDSFPLMVIFVILMTLTYQRKRESIPMLCVLCLSLLLTICVSFGLKFMVSRPCPHDLLKILQGANQVELSFPSFTASIIATFSGVLWCFFDIAKVQLRSLVVFITLVSGVNKIVHGTHFPLDVFAGWVIGVFMSFFVYNILTFIIKNRYSY